MQQDVYFPAWPSLDAISGTYNVSSFFLLAGVIIFSVIIIIALVSLVRIIISIYRLQKEQKAVYADMEAFYRKQLQMLHGKHFLSSLYQYIKLLTQLRSGQDMKAIQRTLGFDEALIADIEHTILSGNELDYEQEKRIKDILHEHISL